MTSIMRSRGSKDKFKMVSSRHSIVFITRVYLAAGHNKIEQVSALHLDYRVHNIIFIYFPSLIPRRFWECTRRANTSPFGSS